MRSDSVVIIPTYNEKENIENIIRAVFGLEQPFDMLIIDDGSPDGSGAICDRYAASHPNQVRALHQPNGGAGAARNRGIELAQGDYLLFVDGDDWLAPKLLEDLSASIAATPADLYLFGALVERDGKVTGELHEELPADLPTHTKDAPQLFFGVMAPWNRAYRRTLFTEGGIRFATKVWYEDIRIVTKVLALAEQVVRLPGAYYHYLQREGSAMNNKNCARNVEILYAFDDILGWFGEHGLREAYRDTRFGAYKILYIAPERLLTDGFCALAQELEISLLAVDEAHCISQWGQDFRPSYLKILDFLQKLPRRPALAAFTATATAQVRSDIVRILQLQDPVTVVTGFDRPNLRFEVLRPQDKRRALLELLEERRDKSGIVYCATRKGVEQICELLQSSGFAASRYHAGLSPDERRQNQEDFICDRCTVMVATNAFGMGIDKSNVSYVIHCNMPKSVEAYYQEAGRAGRDGAPADCILLFSPGDITTAKYLILNQTENDELTDEERQAVQAQDLIRLEQMTGYCKTTGCLRGYLLDYFGQPHAPRCENCGNCQAEYDLQDLTREAQMILSCVVRVRTRLGYCVGTALLGQVLRGSRAARVRELGLEDLPTYGLMRDLPAGRIRELLELLEAGGYLQTDPVHGGVDTTPQAAEVLFHGQRVEVSVKRQPLQDQPARGRAKAKAERPKKAEDDLLAALKALRLRLSQEQHIPAYIICTNATLLDMAARRPRTIEELLEVSGIGQAKAERFGDAFLKELEHYEQTHGRNAP